MAVFLQTFVELLLTALFVLVFGRVLVSWVDPQARYRATAFIIQATEPLLAPVRRFMPRTGMMDFSATIVLLILFALMRAF
ncbi:MAG: YggT family protein [Chloroflexota bacterium]|nr:YggT family protein [Chloroflexota bacterium]